MSITNSKQRMVGSVAVGLSLAVGTLIGTATVASAHGRTSLHGHFDETEAGAALGYDIHGSARLTIRSKGTVARVKVNGLEPGGNYGSHLHNGTCASGGGGHYQDVEGGATTPPNELWLTNRKGYLVPKRSGVARGSGRATWTPRLSSTATNARSIVVHEPDTGVRIACADLL